MDLGIQGKTAVISGSSAGIGYAAALRFAEEGARVVINGRSPERVDAAVAAIRKSCPEADVSGVAADLGTAPGCAALIKAVPDADILVNNLGIFEPKTFDKIGDEDWQRFFEINVMSGVRLTRHYLAGMKARDWGRVVFISSESGVQIPEEMIHYGVTKTAQIGLARGIAETTKNTGVTVNSILVGPTRSEGVETFVTELAREQGKSLEVMEEEFFQSARPTSLLQRFITVEEAANLIVYTCSAAASATNGAPLRVDGGVIRAAF